MQNLIQLTHDRAGDNQAVRSVAIDTQINSKLHNAEKQWSKRLDAIRRSAEMREGVRREGPEGLINWK